MNKEREINEEGTEMQSIAWQTIYENMNKEREINEECSSEDSSIRIARLKEESGVQGYFIGMDENELPTIVIWGEDGEMAPVAIEDPENIELHINVYRVERCYGGPEEGGWYYDAARSIETIKLVWDPEYDNDNVWEYFNKQLLKFKKHYNNDGCLPLSSVLSTGQYEVRLEVFPKESETTNRPCYC